MKTLWAPWRKEYIRPSHKHYRDKGCLFCRLAKTQNLSEHYILLRSTHSYAVLNIYPYNNGHLLIVPARHVDRMSKLTDAEKLDLWNLQDVMIDLLKKSMHASGINVGLNLGSHGGAGIPKHLHIHVVPRWQGDTNYMPIIAGTKIISESLQSVYRILSQTIQKRGLNKKMNKSSRKKKKS